eukprot:gnl/MRDRNA2_/MRDRNA2_104078_c0_seq1.p1 gnl/MRDRNA2_/MRDRNA2_104078_c0~~gnl/MRDRNA2_/MRDRNA2_104078_c0_seq1.p1  ORF type:complete len:569 (+),score=125.11 gnl/MRDRNA2_/MRDRNA2_104078_c0_seq1:197-1708(+)
MDGIIDGKLPYMAFAKAVGGDDDDGQSEIALAQSKYATVITQLEAKFKENWSRGLGSESFLENTFVRPLLKDCVFVGHVNTDLDSIAGAICAAELFKGQPLRAEEKFNGEIEYALKYTGLPIPPTFDEFPGAAAPDAKGKYKKVCLVDHNELDQMTPSLKKDPKRSKRIVGLIDHHAVAASFSTPSPLFMDVRPWGSMCTIVAHLFLRNRVPIRREIARLLLCAILSDTLNLKSGTTTSADKFAVALLAAFGEVEDVDELAMGLFKAKTNWIVGLGAYEMVRGDQKNFVAENIRYSIAVLEVTTLEPVLAISEDILAQLRVFKYEKGDIVDDDTGEKTHDPNKECHCALLFVVDTVKQQSVALCCGGREKFLLQKAFPDGTWRKAHDEVRAPSENVLAEETLCDVGKLVSRKLEFLPMCSKVLGEGVPDYFTAKNDNGTQAKLVKALEECHELRHDSVQVVWDRKTICGAIFGSDEKTLKALQEMQENAIKEEPEEVEAAPAA